MYHIHESEDNHHVDSTFTSSLSSDQQVYRCAFLSQRFPPSAPTVPHPPLSSPRPRKVLMTLGAFEERMFSPPIVGLLCFISMTLAFRATLRQTGRRGYYNFSTRGRESCIFLLDRTNPKCYGEHVVVISSLPSPHSRFIMFLNQRRLITPPRMHFHSVSPTERNTGECILWTPCSFYQRGPIFEFSSDNAESFAKQSDILKPALYSSVDYCD